MDFMNYPRILLRENSNIIHHFITNNYCNVESIYIDNYVVYRHENKRI